jgi:hypothetical protein
MIKKPIEPEIGCSGCYFNNDGCNNPNYPKEKSPHEAYTFIGCRIEGQNYIFVEIRLKEILKYL